jgi:molybdenum cofactor cytidylyltransferase
MVKSKKTGASRCLPGDGRRTPVRSGSEIKICGIILAAGESKRMNEAKMLLPYQGETIIEKVILNVRASAVDSLIVVTGAYSGEIRKRTDHLNVRFHHNENYRKGMLSSVQCGFGSLPAGCDAAIVILGDQPMIESDVINLLINSYQNSEKSIILPVFKGVKGHPVVINCSYREEIMMLDPDIGLKGLLEKHADDILEIEVDTSSVLRDIDTKEDYLRELKQTR